MSPEDLKSSPPNGEKPKADVVIRILRVPHPMQAGASLFTVDTQLPPALALNILQQLAEELRYAAFIERMQKEAPRVVPASGPLKSGMPFGGKPKP